MTFDLTTGREHLDGFTLPEMLIALAIFAAMGTLTYLTLSQAIILRDRVSAEREFWRGLAITFSRLEDDFAQARARAGHDYSGTLTAALSGSSGAVTREEETIVEFTRAGVGVSDDARRSDMQRVAYAVKAHVLLRQSWPTPDPIVGSKPNSTRMLDAVKQIRLQYMGADRIWLDEWPPRSFPPATLPVGVKVSLQVKDGGEYTRIFALHD
jgi:general secretion pathway protein J